MANNRVALDNARCKLIEYENQYYKAAAEYMLHTEGVKKPDEKQIRETIKLLSHIYFGLSILLEKPLTSRELDVIYRAACGEEVLDTSANFNTSESNVRKLRISALKKLQSENIAQATYRATRLGYLPLKEQPSAIHVAKAKEVENASI